MEYLGNLPTLRLGSRTLRNERGMAFLRHRAEPLIKVTLRNCRDVSPVIDRSAAARGRALKKTAWSFDDFQRRQLSHDLHGFYGNGNDAFDEVQDVTGVAHFTAVVIGIVLYL